MGADVGEYVFEAQHQVIVPDEIRADALEIEHAIIVGIIGPVCGIVHIVHLMTQDAQSAFVHESFQEIPFQRVSPVGPGVIGVFGIKAHMRCTLLALR